jgi:colanic acid/amylovoran biosynthesis glycosyltransferase
MKQKILFYSDRFGGPTTTFIYNDLTRLSDKHEVKYLCTHINQKNTFAFDHIIEVPYLIDPVRRKIRWILEEKGLYLTFKNKPFAKKTNEVISAYKPDIIQCQFGYEALKLTDNLNAENIKIPIVINFLGYDASFQLKRNSYVRKLQELAKKDNIYATCNTTFLKHNLESKNIFFKNNRVIYTGIRHDFFKRDHSKVHSETPYTFLQIAVQSERKGHKVSIEAFSKFLKKVKDPDNYFLDFAGGDENNYTAELQSLVKEMGLQEKIKFTGWIKAEEAKELMQNANCFIHHSRTIEGKTEGIPTAVTEAMSMELPILATYHAGIPELVENGVNGYLVNENDVESYAQRMLDIISWKLLPINREKVIQKFTLDTRIKLFEDYYEAILQKKL